ncbi:JmjC domain-containing histone demethylation protein 1 [Blastocladiella emersonii ATCC 22665]|nr:JmjC domain-containing histone demethylation protein 1 [Blastocladiella emersonii ATCC 22665]
MGSRFWSRYQKKELTGSNGADAHHHLEGIVQFKVRAGQTAFLPPGLLHAVYTPNDSFVIAGNFLTFAAAGMHLDVVELEQAVNNAAAITLPAFPAAVVAAVLRADVTKLTAAEAAGRERLASWCLDWILAHLKKAVCKVAKLLLLGGSGESGRSNKKRNSPRRRDETASATEAARKRERVVRAVADFVDASL